jgi:hypothetical protein
MAIWNIDDDYDEDADEDLDADLYDKDELDRAFELEEEDDDLELFEIKCKNCGAFKVEDGYCEVCGWLAGV